MQFSVFLICAPMTFMVINSPFLCHLPLQLQMQVWSRTISLFNFIFGITFKLNHFHFHFHVLVIQTDSVSLPYIQLFNQKQLQLETCNLLTVYAIENFIRDPLCNEHISRFKWVFISAILTIFKGRRRGGEKKMWKNAAGVCRKIWFQKHQHIQIHICGSYSKARQCLNSGIVLSLDL